MTIHHECVEAELTVQLVEPDGESLPLTAKMRYEPRNPYAVDVEFHGGLGSMVTWTFARDLLRAGVDAPAGEGDVQIWPAELGAGPVTLALSGTRGRALFEMPRKAVLAFLARTYTAVPLDAEGRYFDVDEFVSTLTG